MSKVWKVSGICEARPAQDRRVRHQRFRSGSGRTGRGRLLAGSRRRGTCRHRALCLAGPGDTDHTACRRHGNLRPVRRAWQRHPEDGILFPIEAYVRDSNDRDVPIEIIRRSDYEAIEDKAESGKPDRIYIDRLAADQNVSVFPVPTDTSYSIRLVAQTYAPDFVGSNLRSANGNVAHGLSAEWQRWMILQNAVDIGSGPVRRLPPGEISEIRSAAEVARRRADGVFERREGFNAAADPRSRSLT